MTELQTIQSITSKVLNDTATDAEKQLLQEYFDTTTEADVSLVLFPATPGMDGGLLLERRVKDQMLKAIKADALYRSTLATTARVYSISRKRLFYAAACFLVLLAGGAFAFFLRSTPAPSVVYASVATAYGQQRKVLLPDGTQVLMNAGSQLRYASAYSDTSREIFLEGEAFFQVAKDSKRPFIIHAGEMSTRVLGTSFNVRAYAEEATKTVQVKTGKVLVALEQPANEDIAHQMIVTPEQQVSYTPGNRQGLTEQAIGNDDIASWISHKLIFNDKPLSEILRELERVYNVSFTNQSPGTLTRRYTIRFDEMPLDQTIETIHLLTNLEFEKHDSFISVHSKKVNMKKS
jgi:ferric-dicitrate binding protein FerR (iron transport regulator)